jgi:hypothetical protein
MTREEMTFFHHAAAQILEKRGQKETASLFLLAGAQKVKGYGGCRLTGTAVTDEDELESGSLSHLSVLLARRGVGGRDRKSRRQKRERERRSLLRRRAWKKQRKKSCTPAHKSSTSRVRRGRKHTRGSGGSRICARTCFLCARRRVCVCVFESEAESFSQQQTQFFPSKGAGLKKL